MKYHIVKADTRMRKRITTSMKINTYWKLVCICFACYIMYIYLYFIYVPRLFNIHPIFFYLDSTSCIAIVSVLVSLGLGPMCHNVVVFFFFHNLFFVLAKLEPSACDFTFISSAMCFLSSIIDVRFILFLSLHTLGRPNVCKMQLH